MIHSRRTSYLVRLRLGRVVSAVAFVMAAALASGATSAQGPAQPAAAVNQARPATSASADLADSSSTMIRVLLEQASYWLAKYQADRAIESLSRVLILDRSNADALVTLVMIQAELGQAEAAQGSFTRLLAAHPNDPRIPGVEQSLRMGEVDQVRLAEARRLAREEHSSEAVALYQRLFKGGTPPRGLAVEYYQTLGGTEGGFDLARNPLAQLVAQDPEDLRAQLALAQVETLRDETRADGIKRLEALISKPTVAQQANLLMRDALSWNRNDPVFVPVIEAYLRRNPDDVELKAKLELARNPPGKVRLDAFEALRQGRVADAEAGFQSALALDPKDMDAVGGLGLVRYRQARLPEAHELLTRAAAVGPEWETALKSGIFEPPTKGGKNSGNNAGQAAATQYARVDALARAGQVAKAETTLLRLIGRNGNWGNYLQLGTLQAQQGELAEAEA